MTLQKWHAKTVLSSSGQSVLKNLKVLNKGLVEGIEGTMRSKSEKERVVARTRIIRGQWTRIGELQETTNVSFADASDGATVEVASGAKPSSAPRQDSEAFDDTDFYTLLLRTLLTAKLNASTATGSTSATDLLNQLSKSKNRKNVDRRASKGRKIRFNVLEKLEGFMASEPMPGPHKLPGEFRGGQRNDKLRYRQGIVTGEAFEDLYGGLGNKKEVIEWTDDRVNELFRGIFGRLNVSQRVEPLQTTFADPAFRVM